ncbi:hypothetical protein Sste5344_005138 [Sporothrix stenoceras]
MLSRFLSLALAGTQAAPLVKRVDFDEWTIRGFHWDCTEDGVKCVYGFTIAEESSVGPPNVPSFCHFTINGEDGDLAVRNPFIDVPCDEIDNYLCSASWSDNGYMVFTIDDIENSRRGYFGIPDSELVDGSFSSTHHSPAYVVVPSPITSAATGLHLHTRDEVPDITSSDVAVDDASNEITAHKEDVPSAPKTYTIYENAASQAYAVEDADALADIPVDTIQPAPEAADVNLSDNNSGSSMLIETSTQDAVPQDSDGAAVSSYVELNTQDEVSPDDISSAIPDKAAVDTPVNASKDAPVAVSVNTTSSLPQAVQDAIPEQLASVLGGDDDDDSDDINAKPVTSSPIFNDGLPTVPESPITWSLRNFTRDVSYSPNSILIGFLIEILPDGQEPVSCHVTVDFDENTEPMFASFAAVQCQESDWYLSWGYNEMTDSAVATLISPDRTKEAWYGWDAVNSMLPNIALASVGPGIVQTCDC